MKNVNTISFNNIESKMLLSARYLSVKQVLEIEFNSGEIYWYKDVPMSITLGLLEADSKGKYFLDNIKDQYQYDKLETD